MFTSLSVAGVLSKGFLFLQIFRVSPALFSSVVTVTSINLCLLQSLWFLSKCQAFHWPKNNMENYPTAVIWLLLLFHFTLWGLKLIVTRRLIVVNILHKCTPYRELKMGVVWIPRFFHQDENIYTCVWKMKIVGRVLTQVSLRDVVNWHICRNNRCE